MAMSAGPTTRTRIFVLAPVQSAVDPRTVERAWFMASRWSAPLDERPGRHRPRLLGSAWVDGGRDGEPPTLTTMCPRPGTAPPSHSVPADPPPEASSVTEGALLRALSMCGRTFNVSGVRRLVQAKPGVWCGCGGVLCSHN